VFELCDRVCGGVRGQLEELEAILHPSRPGRAAPRRALCTVPEQPRAGGAATPCCDPAASRTVTDTCCLTARARDQSRGGVDRVFLPRAFGSCHTARETPVRSPRRSSTSSSGGGCRSSRCRWHSRWRHTWSAALARAHVGSRSRQRRVALCLVIRGHVIRRVGSHLPGWGKARSAMVVFPDESRRGSA
jgi:hypothetical protein